MHSIDVNQPQIHKDQICAVVVTHNPDDKLIRLLSRLMDQVAKTVLVDNRTNAPSQAILHQASRLPKVTLIENPTNRGVATALNQGLAEASQSGFAWAITFDQDSEPDSGMVKQICAALHSAREIDKIAIIGPQVIDANLRRKSRFLRRNTPFLFQRTRCQEDFLTDVTAIITSGAMIRIDGFRDEFFMDYVDTDFCLRTLLRGYRILVACKALLFHTFGSRKQVVWGPFTFFPSFHPPERWYTISRNRVQMIKNYAFRFPHWFAYDLTATGFILLRMLLVEDKKGAKILNFLRGTWDGVCGRLGEPGWANPSTGVYP
jgi:rhamnosyltransferase